MNLIARPSLVARSWQRIERWLTTFAPAALAQLLPGASPVALIETEARLGVKLPADFKASCLFHNGMKNESRLLLGKYDLYPLGAVADLRNHTAQAPSRTPSFVKEGMQLPVQPVWWHPSWLDIANDLSGTLGQSHLCLDLAPPAGGTLGQILVWSDDGAVADVLFPSFGVLLSTYADQLEAGLYPMPQPLPFPLRKIAYLAQRRMAFSERTAAKGILEQAIRSGWQLAFSPGFISLADLVAQSDLVPQSSVDASLLSILDSSLDLESNGAEEDLFTYGHDKGYEEDLSAYERTFDQCVALYRAVLTMKEATIEDRCFAYYGWLSLYALNGDFSGEPTELLLSQWQEIVEPLPPTHWAKLEVSLLKRWWL